jgi:3-mercaptopyruvate sulfurtransferase SseA
MLLALLLQMLTSAPHRWVDIGHISIANADTINSQACGLVSMQEYQAGHVPGAVNLPLGPTLPDDLRNKYSIEEKLVIACQAGNRSTTAMQVR